MECNLIAVLLTTIKCPTFTAAYWLHSLQGSPSTSPCGTISQAHLLLPAQWCTEVWWSLGPAPWLYAPKTQVSGIILRNIMKKGNYFEYINTDETWNKHLVVLRPNIVTSAYPIYGHLLCDNIYPTLCHSIWYFSAHPYCAGSLLRSAFWVSLRIFPFLSVPHINHSYTFLYLSSFKILVFLVILLWNS